MKNLMLTVFLFTLSSSLFAVPFTFEAGKPARASEVNDNFNSLDSAIDDLQGDLFTLNLFATGTSNDLSSLSSTVSTQGSNLSTLSTTVSGHTTSITSIQNSISAINTDLSSAETAIGSLESDVTTLDSVVTANTDDLSLLDSVVSSIETSITSIQSAITTIQTAIGSIESETTDLDTRVSSLESAPGAGCPAESGEWYLDYISYTHNPLATGTTLSLMGGVDNYTIQKLPVLDVTTGKKYVVTFPSSGPSNKIYFSLYPVFSNTQGIDCYNDFLIGGYESKMRVVTIFSISNESYEVEHGGGINESNINLVIKVDNSFVTIIIPNSNGVEENIFSPTLAEDGSDADITGIALNTTLLDQVDNFIDYITVEEVTE